jgi:hypothetical protein
MRLDEFINLVLSPVGGVSVFVTALGAILGKIWVGRVLNRQVNQLQQKLDSTNSRLQAELDKGLHIHRIQFEKEFKIYEELWAKLIELRRATLSLRPVMDSIDPKETDSDRKTKRLTNFSDAVGGFIDVTDKNRPFYSEDVYRSMGNLWSLTHSEAIEYKHQNPHNDGYWEKAQKNRDEILAEIEKCCLKIRDRISSVKVSE